MSYVPLEFPSRQQLWHGVVLATIAQAIRVASDESPLYFQSWDGSNFNINTHSGERVCICFTADRVVGAAFDIHSPRSPYRRAFQPITGDHYDLGAFFTGAPDDVVALAHEQPLQYLLDDYEGVVQPIISAAFWSEGEMLTAAEPWSRVVEHGVRVLDIELMEPDDAIDAWQEEKDLSDEQTQLLRSIFERKIAQPTTTMLLTEDERRLLTAEGDAGLDETRALLTAIGIALPEPAH